VNRAEQVIEHTLNGYLLSLFKAHQEATRMDPIGDFIERHMPHHAAPQPEEHAMTTPASTSTQGPDPSSASFWAMLHHNLDLFTGSMERFLPKLAAIATNPALDDGVEALLAAFAGPMAPEVFAGVITLLKADPADHMDAAIGLLTTVAHQAPAADPVLAGLQASAQGLRQAVAAGGGDVQAQLGAQQQAAGTGSQPAMAPRVI
jgi:hypothetical protein